MIGQRTVTAGFPVLGSSSSSEATTECKHSCRSTSKNAPARKCARGVKVARRHRIASLHDLRAHYYSRRTCIRMGSSFNKQAARPTEQGSSDVFGGGVGWRTSKTMSSSVVCNRPLPASSWMSEMTGRLCEGYHDKTSAGRADGRPIVI